MEDPNSIENRIKRRERMRANAIQHWKEQGESGECSNEESLRQQNYFKNLRF